CVIGLFPSGVVMHDHSVPVLCEGGGDRSADTSGSACHQDVACPVRCGGGFWTVTMWRRHGGILARCGFLPVKGILWGVAGKAWPSTEVPVSDMRHKRYECLRPFFLVRAAGWRTSGRKPCGTDGRHPSRGVP